MVVSSELGVDVDDAGVGERDEPGQAGLLGVVADLDGAVDGLKLRETAERNQVGTLADRDVSARRQQRAEPRYAFLGGRCCIGW